MPKTVREKLQTPSVPQIPPFPMHLVPFFSWKSTKIEKYRSMSHPKGKKKLLCCIYLCISWYLLPSCMFLAYVKNWIYLQSIVVTTMTTSGYRVTLPSFWLYGILCWIFKNFAFLNFILEMYVHARWFPLFCAPVVPVGGGMWVVKKGQICVQIIIEFLLYAVNMSKRIDWRSHGSI